MRPPVKTARVPRMVGPMARMVLRMTMWWRVKRAEEIRAAGQNV